MKQKAGKKLNRSGKDKSYYTLQFARTAANKARRVARAARRLKYWMTEIAPGITRKEWKRRFRSTALAL